MDIVFENTAFNKNHWAQFSEALFVAQNIKAGVFGSYSMNDRIELLKQVYKLIVA